MAHKVTASGASISFRIEEIIDVPYKVLATPRWAAETLPLNLPRENLLVVRKAADLLPIHNELARSAQIGGDTESTGPREEDGLDAVSPTSRIVLGQLGAPNGTVYLIDPDLLEQFRWVFESDQHCKIFQNGVHDYRFLYQKAGIEVVRMYCTMLAEQVLTAGKLGRSVGLADLVRKYMPYRLITKNVREDFIQFEGRLTLAMLFYAARDIKLLFEVYKAQCLMLRSHELRDTAQLEFDCISSAAEMTLNGMYLDESYLQQTIDYATREMETTVKQIFDLYNGELRAQNLTTADLFGDCYETFTISSNQDKMAALRRIGIDVDDAEYDTMARLKHPIGKLFCKWSGLQKLLSTYGQSLLDRRHWHTKRIHPKMDQLGAGEGARHKGKDKTETIATGRWSGDMQQLPRPERFTVPVSPELEALLRVRFARELAALEIAAA
jgi:DNA polymerase I-like protein with 3'-5' exonuclease and polymerase domains